MRYGLPMRRLLVPATIVLLAIPFQARAGKVEFATGPFVVNCTSTGQLCDPPRTLTIGDPTRRLTLRKIAYTASAEACSAGRVLIEIDGQPFAAMRFVVGRERAVIRKRRSLAPGDHTLAFRLEGRPGGCNVGYVGSWGGEIVVTARR